MTPHGKDPAPHTATDITGDTSDTDTTDAAAAAATDTEDGDDADIVIDFRGVHLQRDGATLVGPLDWQVELDERWVIIGPNGAGKTSLMRLAGAQEFPSAGRARILGDVLGRVEVSELRTRIGMSSVALAERIPPGEKVSDLVISAGYNVLGRWREHYDPIDYDRAADTLESMGAEHLADRTWGTLSEGERKRVLISRALMTDPELLLFDEPGAGLDLGGREELVSRLADLAADPDAPTMVLVTHHVEEIPQGFTNAMILAGGRVHAVGLIDDVMTSENLSAAFAQNIVVERRNGRYFAYRKRPGRHRRHRST